MRRRTLLQSILVAIPLRVRGQTVAFPGPHEKTLKDLAAAVLPASLGRARIDTLADQFTRWVREYRVGAEMQHGYGFTRVRYKSASPAPAYIEQLAQIGAGAITPQRLTEILRAANIKDLPGYPDGTHIISDLMSFYFQSPEANDRAYQALVGRDQCRTLADSSAEPKPLKGGSTDAAH